MEGPPIDRAYFLAHPRAYTKIIPAPRTKTMAFTSKDFGVFKSLIVKALQAFHQDFEAGLVQTFSQAYLNQAYLDTFKESDRDGYYLKGFLKIIVRSEHDNVDPSSTVDVGLRVF